MPGVRDASIFGSVTTDIPAELQSALAERYELRRVLGRGGMAVVYLTDRVAEPVRELV